MKFRFETSCIGHEGESWEMQGLARKQKTQYAPSLGQKSTIQGNDTHFRSNVLILILRKAFFLTHCSSQLQRWTSKSPRANWIFSPRKILYDLCQDSYFFTKTFRRRRMLQYRCFGKRQARTIFYSKCIQRWCIPFSWETLIFRNY